MNLPGNQDHYRNESCIRDKETLLKLSINPNDLEKFLLPPKINGLNGNWLTKPKSDDTIYKSIIILHGDIGANLHIVGDGNYKLPMINRTGRSSPYMIITELGGATTEPDEQRYRNDYISLRLWKKEMEKLFGDNFTKEVEEKLGDRTKNIEKNRFEEQEVDDDLLKILNSVKDPKYKYIEIFNSDKMKPYNHLSYHHKKIKTHKNIVIQGCGDISMNSWNVAYLKIQENKNKIMHQIIHTPNEPLDQRNYSCLIATENGIYIENVHYNQYGEEHNLIDYIVNNDCIDRKNIKFALYGKRIAWDGRVLERRKIIHEFADIRHLISMPNLNPDSKTDINKIQNILNTIALDTESKHNRELGYQLFIRELEEPKKVSPQVNYDHILETYASSPRVLFGRVQKNNVWLGEAAFYDNPHLAQAACEGPVGIALWRLGAPVFWITYCLLENDYCYKDSKDKVTSQGDFTWDLLDDADPVLFCFFKEAVYPCTMIGVGKLGKKDANEFNSKNTDENALFLLAWGHSFQGTQKYTLSQCAHYLCDLGAERILVMDEGQDVFQFYFEKTNEMDVSFKDQDSSSANQYEIVPPSKDRNRIRGTICFYTKG